MDKTNTNHLPATNSSSSFRRRNIVYGSPEAETRSAAASIWGKQSAGFIGGKMFDYFLTRFVQVNKDDGVTCTVKITHNLVDRELTSPKVYTNRGTTKTPPAYKISAGFKDADKKSAIFEADDKIRKKDWVSAGAMTYDIGDKHLLVVIWSVVKHGTFAIGEGQNTFYFALLNKNILKVGWQQNLADTFADVYAKKRYFTASSTGHYVELVNKKEDKTVDFTIRTHMTNDKNAQLVMIIEDANAPKAETLTKRDFGISLGIGALFTVLGSLSKMALRHLPTGTQSIVVTIKNDFVDANLEDPKWEIKQTIIFDSIPYEIPVQEERKFTFKIPFAYTGEKSLNVAAKFNPSAIFVSYRIKGSDKRLTLTIWWGRKLKRGEESKYSISLMAANISPTLISNIIENPPQTNSENVLVASSYLDYQCKEEDYNIVDPTISKPVKKIIRASVIMGDATESNIILNIGERKGNKLDRVMRSFQSCYEKPTY